MKASMALALALICAAPSAEGVSIGIFSTPDCSSCNLSIPLGTPGTFYINLVPDGLWVSGAELRLVGLPDWFVLSVTPNPAAILVLGNPLGAGTNIAFSTYYSGDCLNLFTVQVFATSQVDDVTLRVVKHGTPSNPLMPCPVVIYDCFLGAARPGSEQCFTAMCASGGELFLNSTRDCSVPVAERNWTAVKRLYE